VETLLTYPGLLHQTLCEEQIFEKLRKSAKEKFVIFFLSLIQNQKYKCTDMEYFDTYFYSITKMHLPKLYQSTFCDTALRKKKKKIKQFENK